MVEHLKKGKFTQFHWTAPQTGLHTIVDESFRQDPYFSSGSTPSKFLLQFIDNELGFGREPAGENANHITYMKKHDLVDYCPVSEKGHMKWYPKGMLMRNLMLAYAKNLALEWGAFEMGNPLIIRGDNDTVGKLMGEFHERDYKVDGGRGTCLLRYASDPLGFPFMQDMRYTVAQSPLRVYEAAYCFRNEQEGEVSGLKRMRWFIMTDMHGVYQTAPEAKQEYERLTRLFADLMNDVIAKGRWVLGWEMTEEYYNREKAWFKDLSDSIGAPSFFKLIPEMSHYYAFKNEFQSVNSDGSNIQVSTVQWDVKNGPRFDIGPIGADGKKQPAEVILHASSFGSIERALCSILENIAIDEREGKTPEYPLWLAPTQVRFLPIAPEHTPLALAMTRLMSGAQVRADIDDREGTLGKKIRNAETDWVPYIVVIGDKELHSGQFPVRVRSEGKTYTRSKEDIVTLVREQTARFPYEQLSLSPLLSRRPSFK